MMPSDPAEMRVQVVRALGAYAPAWDALIDASPIPSPFLRSWWLSSAFGSQPVIVLVLEGERIVGGLALERDRHIGVERLRVLGAGALCPDHLDAVAAIDRRGEVAAALRSWLGRSGDRLVDLEGVVTDSLIATCLPRGVHRKRSAVAPWVALSGGYLEDRSASLRRLVTRTERRIVREAGSCIVERVDDTEEGLRILRRLHSQRWGGDSAFLRDFERFATVARAAAATGELVVYALHGGGETVAILASFEVAGRASYYQSGRSPAAVWRNASTVLLALAVEDAAHRGVREADFLRGDEPYKSHFAAAQRELFRVRSATGVRAALAMRIDLATERGRRLVASSRRFFQHRRPSTTAGSQ
jgi:CelD/BcsL family acetyltransferase involved in cellulose biosynthesis